MSPESKIWIYQADRLLSDGEVVKAQEMCNAFCSTWNSHGTQLAASIEIKNKLHIVVAVDQSHKDASGCSIDSSVHFIKKLGSELNVDFFNRMNVAYQVKGENQIASIHHIGDKIDSDTLVYDNLIDSYNSLETSWLKQAKDTWVATYLNS